MSVAAWAPAEGSVEEWAYHYVTTDALGCRLAQPPKLALLAGLQGHNLIGRGQPILGREVRRRRGCALPSVSRALAVPSHGGFD